MSHHVNVHALPNQPVTNDRFTAHADHDPHAFTSGWGVVTSNYSVLKTDCVVTNAIGGATRFYRLRKP